MEDAYIVLQKPLRFFKVYQIPANTDLALTYSFWRRGCVYLLNLFNRDLTFDCDSRFFCSDIVEILYKKNSNWPPCLSPLSSTDSTLCVIILLTILPLTSYPSYITQTSEATSLIWFFNGAFDEPIYNMAVNTDWIYIWVYQTRAEKNYFKSTRQIRKKTKLHLV